MTSVEGHLKDHGATRYRLVRTKSDLTIGVVARPGYRILNLERALLEGLRLATKIGERTAIGARYEELSRRD